MSKQTIEQRAVAAVKAVAVVRAEVERLTKAIGEALAKCPGVNGGLVSATPDKHGFVFPVDGSDITHLKHAYTPEQMDERVDYMDDDEIHDYLEEACQHCLQAHQLVKQRRIARQQHGRAKATVTKIGRQLVKGGA